MSMFFVDEVSREEKVASLKAIECYVTEGSYNPFEKQIFS